VQQLIKAVRFGPPNASNRSESLIFGSLSRIGGVVVGIIGCVVYSKVAVILTILR
jgi:hypothetical protein